MSEFNQFNISKELQQAIAEMGFIKPSPVQAQAIPVLLNGRDLVAQAQTGTGKTVAFGIPCIEKIDPNNKATQALIMCPTRELAVQVAEEFKKLSKKHRNIYTCSVYGGQNIETQLKVLRKGAQIVVGTPGRLMDHMRRKSLKLDQIKYLVLDEADQMLDMGFREDMETIITKTPSDRQTLMFSATIPKQLASLMDRYQTKAVKINTTGEGVQNKQIKQLYFHIPQANKFDVMVRLLEHYRIMSGIIFCNTKIMVDQLSKRLAKNKYRTAALHGDIPQNKRSRVMQSFKKAELEILVATDVAARGLDINGLEAVINYDLPKFDQDYVHRIGRTGRAGKEGLALSLIVGGEIEHIERIGRRNKLKIENAQEANIEGLEDIKYEKVKIKNKEKDTDTKRNFRKKSFRKPFKKKTKKPRKLTV